MDNLAYELRLGNHVMYNGYPALVYGVTGPQPSENDRFDSKFLVTLSLGGLITIPVDEVVPIELTEEILQKLGFIKVDEDVEFRSLYEIDPLLAIDLTDYRVRYIDSWLMEYKYVHQIQNLYYSLVGKELKIGQ